ncbi:UNVERIFIED_CONTAM: hypothetical protein RMT77_000254 [Armadillidium vulgare]
MSICEDPNIQAISTSPRTVRSGTHSGLQRQNEQQGQQDLLLLTSNTGPDCARQRLPTVSHNDRERKE